MTVEGGIYNASYDSSTDFVWDKMWEYIWTLRTPYVVTLSLETNTVMSDVDFDNADIEDLATCNDIGTRFESGILRIGSAYVGWRHMFATSRLWVRIASNSQATVETLQKLVVDSLEPIAQEDNKVRVKFWNWGGHSPDYHIRHLDAPTWEDIKENYAPSVRGDLDKFVKLTPDSISGGRLAIIHGPPGTGKTTMIRALCREWKSWANIDYIIDPEQFFGNAQYMTNCLLAPPEEISNPESDFYDDDDDDIAISNIFRRWGPRGWETTQTKASPWRLLVIEDAEDFISPTARENVGQAMSRLLNVGDGFIGQGLHILILLTTNTPLQDVHPAIKRPGRCFANIEVPKLTSSEATKWLGKIHDTEATLAELYEERKESQIGSGVSQFKPTGYL